MSASGIPREIDYAPRGPIAHAIRALTAAIVIFGLGALIIMSLNSYFTVRGVEKADYLNRQVAMLRAENASLKKTAADNQRTADARSLAAQQALSLLVQQIGQIKTLSPDQAQAVIGALNSAIAQTTQNLQKQGVSVPAIPKISLSPAVTPRGTSPLVPAPGSLKPQCTVNLPLLCNTPASP